MSDYGHLLEQPIFFNGVERRFITRMGTSDANMLAQTFREDAPALVKLKRWPEILECERNLSRPLIVDAGANIGTSALFFALLFPRAAIFAYEPEISNFVLLMRNTAGLPGVVASHSAISGSGFRVEVFHPKGEPQPGHGHAGFQTRKKVEGGEGTIASRTISNILLSTDAQPFIAKIDIEGGEKDVFEGDTTWIDSFPVLIVEPHDWLYPGQGIARPLLHALASRDRDFVIAGDRIISIRNKL